MDLSLESALRRLAVLGVFTVAGCLAQASSAWCQQPTDPGDGKSNNTPSQEESEKDARSTAENRQGETGEDAGAAAKQSAASSEPSTTGNVDDAPPTSPDAATPSLSLEEITARLKELGEATDMGDDDKKRAKLAYEDARAALESIATSDMDRVRYEQWLDSVDEDLRQAEAALQDPVDKFDFGTVRKLELADLREALSKLDEKRKESTSSWESLKNEQKRRANRLAEEIPRLLAASRQNKEDAEAKLKLLKSSGAPPVLEAARRALFLATIQASNATMATLDKEVEAYAAQRPLLDRRVERAYLLKEQHQDDWERLSPFVANRRLAEVNEQVAEVVGGLPEDVVSDSYYEPLVSRINAVAELWKTRVTALNSASTNLADMEVNQATTSADLKAARSRVEGGASAGIGQVWRGVRATLPSVRGMQRNMAQRNVEIRQIQAEIDEVESRLSNLRNLERATEDAWAKMPGVPKNGEDPQVVVSQLLAGERKLLEGVRTSTNEYRKLLVKLDLAESDYSKLVAEYREFLDEYVFWVRSTKTLSFSDIPRAGEALASFAKLPALPQEIERLWSQVQQRPLLYLAAAALIGGFLYIRRRLVRAITTLGEIALRSPYANFSLSVQALLCTVVVSIFWPAIVVFVSHVFNRIGLLNGGEVARALSQGLYGVGVLLFSLVLFYQTCRPLGLGEAHFNWSPRILKLLRRGAWRLIVFGIPLMCAFTTLVALSALDPKNRMYASYHNSLGRFCFIAYHLVVAWVFHQFFRPRTGVFSAASTDVRTAWVHRLKTPIYVFLLLLPLSFVVMAALGYYDTSLRLSMKLQQSLILAFALVLATAMLGRWVRLTQRGIAIRQDFESRSTSVEVPADMAEAAAQDRIDLGMLRSQVHKFIRAVVLIAGLAGLYLIWQDVLPALAVIDELRLVEIEPEKWITAADVLVTLGIVVLTFVAARNGPSLIEMMLLQRLPIHSSVHYAIKTVAQYVIAAIGVLLVALQIGLTWDNMVWLLAPLGVGLGFGLQEVFANFICGLILLFEQPIRPGDIVTVGDTTGVVTRIRIRATTIRNWDRQELVIPNKDLITGKLINWTLTDTTNRIVIPVGLAYGADTNHARKILLQILEEHPDVLEDPKPLVTFEGFADSSLTLIVRAYLASMDNRMGAIHELHTQIHERFQAEELEIAFPQMDLHLRDVPRGWQSAARGNGATTSPVKSNAAE